ncbi:hypothetical protein EDD86DRAFT_134109 [Gorgonomyces haynaldii]|nr:hypothetical protein EDD86DRAFT_134109 [Gorgonomyces haynaldii]
MRGFKMQNSRLFKRDKGRGRGGDDNLEKEKDRPLPKAPKLPPQPKAKGPVVALPPVTQNVPIIVQPSPQPIPQPSPSPSQEPSPSPSQEPSPSPSQAPVTFPSQEPSPSPSQEPLPSDLPLTIGRQQTEIQETLIPLPTVIVESTSTNGSPTVDSFPSISNGIDPTATIAVFQTQTPQQQPNGISEAGIVGIVVGSLVLVAAVICAIYLRARLFSRKSFSYKDSERGLSTTDLIPESPSPLSQQERPLPVPQPDQVSQIAQMYQPSTMNASQLQSPMSFTTFMPPETNQSQHVSLISSGRVSYADPTFSVQSESLQDALSRMLQPKAPVPSMCNSRASVEPWTNQHTPIIGSNLAKRMSIQSISNHETPNPDDIQSPTPSALNTLRGFLTNILPDNHQ